jgi:MFS family permease
MIQLNSLKPDEKDNRFEHWKRNITLLVTESSLFQTAVAFTDASVMSVFIIQATGSIFLAGLLQMLRTIGLYLPQIFSIRVGEEPYKRKIFLKWTIIGRCCLVFAILPALLLTDISLVVLSVFVSLSFFHAFDGLSIVPWLEFVAKSFPSTKRGTLFGLTQFIGGIGSILAGYLVSKILTNVHFHFPFNFGLLLLFELVILSCGASFLFFLREQPDETPDSTSSFRQSLRNIPRLVQNNKVVKQLTIVQLLISFFSMATPFYSAYALTILNIETSYIGVFLSFQMVGRFAFSFIWAQLCNKKRSKQIIQFTSLMFVIASILAIIAKFLPLSPNVLSKLMLSVFFLSGAATGGIFLGMNTFVMEIAEPKQRPIILGFLNSLNVVTSILPMIAGMLIEYVSYDVVFSISVIMISLGFIISLKITK